MTEPRRDILVSPSIMCADFLRLEQEIRLFEKYRIPLIHVDIMDGHYVPNFTLGPDFCRRIAEATPIPLDIHLMIEDVDRYIPIFAAFGSPYICIHPEVSWHPLRSLGLIRSEGARPGIAVDPAQSLEQLTYMLPEVEMVCVMTVNPGYSGQKLIPSTLKKIRELAEYKSAHNLDFLIEVDGNVSWENIPDMVAAGGEVLVAGTSSIFSPALSREQGLRRIAELIRNVSAFQPGDSMVG